MSRPTADACNPDLRVVLLPSKAHVHVTFGGLTIAETSRPLLVEETGYAPVYYVPRADVKVNLLRPSDHSTYCPYKGDASYWTIEAGGNTAVNAVWSYAEPFEEVAGLKDHMAFYAERVDEILISEDG